MRDEFISIASHELKTPLTALVDETVERIHPQLEAAGCAISILLDGPVVGKWDRYRIEQIVNNLLTHALRYATALANPSR